jgi:hypothetical protein
MTDRPEPRHEPCPLEWQIWLARRRPGRAAGVLAVIAAAALGALLLFHSVVAVAATVLLLAGALSEFLLPTRYRLAAAGAEARNLLFWRRIEWAEVKRVYLSQG